jgi:hypothetical protein
MAGLVRITSGWRILHTIPERDKVQPVAIRELSALSKLVPDVLLQRGRGRHIVFSGGVMVELTSLPQGVAFKSIAVSAATVALTEPAVQGGQWGRPAPARELPDTSLEIRVAPLSSLPDLDPVSEELFCVYEPPAFAAEVNGLYIATAEGLGAARGALMTICLEASMALCLLGLWKVFR